MLIELMVWQFANPDRPQPSPPLAFSVIQRCPPDTSSGDVVVCGRTDPDRYRLKPLPERYARKAEQPLAQVRIGGSTLSATAEQGSVGNIPTNRAMVKLKIPF